MIFATYDWYLLQPTIFPHFLSAKVSVATSAIPVAWDRLRIKWSYHTKVFTNSVQDETSDPQMISHIDAFTGANLEFPLQNKSHVITNQELTEELRSHSK